MPPEPFDFNLATYFPILLFLVVVVGFSVVSLLLSHLINPGRITPVKQMPYESGMDPIGDAHQQFDVRFYLIAILFLVFDVELLFLYPWAVTFRQLGLYGLVEMVLFILTLLCVYFYVWRRGGLEWD